MRGETAQPARHRLWKSEERRASRKRGEGAPIRKKTIAAFNPPRRGEGVAQKLRGKRGVGCAKGQKRR